MALDVEDVIARLDPTERRKVEEMAAELIAEEMTLRKARQLTQASVTRVPGISQDTVLPDAAERPVAVHAAQDGRSDEQKPLARRQIP